MSYLLAAFLYVKRKGDGHASMPPPSSNRGVGSGTAVREDAARAVIAANRLDVVLVRLQAETAVDFPPYDGLMRTKELHVTNVPFRKPTFAP